MPKAKTFFINGKFAQLSDDVLLEMLVRYAKEYASPNDIYYKVCGEIGIAWTKKSITKLKYMYKKFVKVSDCKDFK